MVNFKLNGKKISVDVENEMPLLWVIRDELKLTGTKYACGIAACGACSLSVNGELVRSCVLPVSSVEGKEVITIEGLSNGTLSTLQKKWIEHQVLQCGFCQSGMIMAANNLLKKNPNPTENDIKSAMTNLCRCGTYPRVKKAILETASELKGW